MESCPRNDFNETLDAFEYSTIRKEKVSIVTMNVCNKLLLIFTEPDIDLQDLANRIQRLLDENKKEYQNLKNRLTPEYLCIHFHFLFKLAVFGCE